MEKKCLPIIAIIVSCTVIKFQEMLDSEVFTINYNMQYGNYEAKIFNRKSLHMGKNFCFPEL